MRRDCRSQFRTNTLIYQYKILCRIGMATMSGDGYHAQGVFFVCVKCLDHISRKQIGIKPSGRTALHTKSYQSCLLVSLTGQFVVWRFERASPPCKWHRCSSCHASTLAVSLFDNTQLACFSGPALRALENHDVAAITVQGRFEPHRGAYLLGCGSFVDIDPSACTRNLKSQRTWVDVLLFVRWTGLCVSLQDHDQLVQRVPEVCHTAVLACSEPTKQQPYLRPASGLAQRLPDLH